MIFKSFKIWIFESEYCKFCNICTVCSPNIGGGVGWSKGFEKVTGVPGTLALQFIEVKFRQNFWTSSKEKASEIVFTDSEIYFWL